METEDPRTALASPEITKRTAAARDLARVGTWDDMPDLVAHATTDKSSAVRLWCAAAAADVAGRLRGAGSQASLTDAQKEQIHAWVKPIDPGFNPSLLMLWSATADAPAIERLGRMLRDPRNGVRGAAMVAFRRMALSAAAADLEALRTAMLAFTQDKRMPADVLVDIARLVGETGWTGFESWLAKIATGGKETTVSLADAQTRLSGRQTPADWEGVWIGDGRDIFELAEPREERVIVVADGRWWTPGGPNEAFALHEGRAKVGEDPVRLVYGPREGDGEARKPALQRAGQTYWRQTGKELVAAVEERLEQFDDPGVQQALIRWLSAGEGIGAQRAHAVVLLRSGQTEAARALLEELAAGKKPRADVYYWLGRAAAAMGDSDAAKAALDQFLERVPKRGEFRREAEELRATL